LDQSQTFDKEWNWYLRFWFWFIHRVYWSFRSRFFVNFPQRIYWGLIKLNLRW